MFQRLFKDPQWRAERRLLFRHCPHGSIDSRYFLVELDSPAVQLDVVGEQSRTLDAHSFHFTRDVVPPRGNLLQLRPESDFRSFLGSAPLIEACQLSPQCGVLLDKARRLALQLIQIFPRLFENLFLHLAGCFLLFDKLEVLLTLRTGALALLAQAPEFHPRNGQALPGPCIFLRELAVFMIESESLALLRLQQTAQPLLLLRALRDLAIELLKQRRRFGHRGQSGLYLRSQLPKFALESQGPAALLLPSAHRITVIADAVRQQEKCVGILYG